MPNVNVRVGNGAAAPYTRPIEFAVTAVWDAADDNALAADSVQAVDIPAGTLVEAIRWKVETAEGALGTFTVGDNAAVDQFLAATNLNALAEGVSAAAARKYYSAADIVRIVPSINSDLVRITLTVVGVSFPV